MENNYDKWSREELLYEVKRLSVELEKVKQLKRLTDDRFVGELIKLSNSKQRKSLLPRLEISLENHGSKWHKFTTKALQEDAKIILENF